MSDTNWQLVQDLFAEAADLPPGERSRFLDAACTGRPELRAELESLLACDTPSAEVLDVVVRNAAEMLIGDDPLLGMRLGAWRIVSDIGRGGMGSVYLAQRDDDAYAQDVAIKVVRRGMDTADVLERFRHERQILATLDHPFIARLIDGGSTPDGRPFLVMEYVQGRPIDRFCMEEGLDTEARCELIVRVSEAVSHAHQRLVVHRDLKPGNILITADGSPRLLDFGVAKILNPDVDVALTAAGPVFTPAYASPEQVAGLPVNTATDTYSLGVILYELLTGRKAGVSDTSGLTGDLEAIVSRASRPEPSERYPSVDALATDLRHYLRGEPVEARRGSVRYRLRKFVRRNRYPLAAGVLIASSLVAATIGALYSARQAELARRAAEARLTQMVDLANKSLSSVYSQLERLPGSTQARREYVGVVFEFVEKLARESGNDERLRIALARAYLRLADVQSDPNGPSLGEAQDGLKSLAAAHDLLAPILAAHKDDPEVLQIWVDERQKYGAALLDAGRSAEADAALREAQAPAARLVKLRPDDPESARREAGILLYRARVLEPTDTAGSLKIGGTYLNRMAQLAERFPEVHRIRYDLSVAHTQFGFMLNHIGDVEAGLEHYRRALEIRDDLVRQFPRDPVYQRVRMLSWGHYGTWLGSAAVHHMGDTEGATRYLTTSVGLAEEILASDPRDRTAKFDLAGLSIRLAAVDVPSSGAARSLALIRRSIRQLEELAAPEPQVLKYRRELSVGHLFAGERLLQMGRAGEAVDEFRSAISFADGILALRPADYNSQAEGLMARQGLAKALLASGHRETAVREAETTLEKAKAGLTAGPDREARLIWVADAWNWLGQIRWNAGALWRTDADEAAAEAVRLYDQLTRGRSKHPGKRGLREAQELLAKSRLQHGGRP